MPGLAGRSQEMELGCVVSKGLFASAYVRRTLVRFSSRRVL